MAGPTSIGPQVLYLSNPQSLNELYDRLRAYKYATQSRPQPGPVIIETPAGEMKLTRVEAERLLEELKKLDAADNPKGEENGWIDPNAVRDYLEGQRRSNGDLPPDYGVRVLY